MKKITKTLFSVLFLALISMSLFITSCDDDDQDPMVGTWKLDKVTMNGDEMDLATLGMSVTVTFKNDGTYSGTGNFGDGTESISGTWERENSTTVYVYEGTERMILKKDGEYYVMTDTEDGYTMKMFFKKI